MDPGPKERDCINSLWTPDCNLWFQHHQTSGPVENTVSIRPEPLEPGSSNTLSDHCCLKLSTATPSVCPNLGTLTSTLPAPQAQKLGTILSIASSCSSNPWSNPTDILNTVSLRDSTTTALAQPLLLFRYNVSQRLSTISTLNFLQPMLPVIAQPTLPKITHSEPGISLFKTPSKSHSIE